MELQKINDFIFSKHSIIPGAQLDSIEKIARNHLGLHSARIGTPYTTLCSRLKKYSPKMLSYKLYDERSLMKLRCMRTTLHIAPKDIAPILFKATLSMRLSECLLFFKRNKIPKEKIEMLAENIVSVFNGTPIRPSEIEKWIVSENKNDIPKNIQKEYSKKVLKYIWEKGIISYYNAANCWENEDRRFVLTKKYYPNFDFQKYRTSEAQRLLILEHIKKFGPVTIKDISWWSGLGMKKVKETIENNSKDIYKLKIKNYDLDFYISVEEVDKLDAFKKIDFEWISLLAFEDPSLKGYYESRFRYVDKMNLNKLFNQIGEVRASIIHNGNAIGIWQWNKKNKEIDISFFKQQNKSITSKVMQERERYENILTPNKQLKLFNSYDFK